MIRQQIRNTQIKKEEGEGFRLDFYSPRSKKKDQRENDCVCSVSTSEEVIERERE